MFFSNRKKKILVIDDDASLRRQLRFHLERREGVDVIEAENGEMGLIQANEHTPDLIILDWMMPGIQGDEVLNRLKGDKKLQNTPVIMLTGKNKIGEIDIAFERGADLYLTKPFMLQQLGVKVRELLGT